MGTRVQPRVPIGPALAAAAPDEPDRAQTRLAEQTGVSLRSVARWVAAGTVPYWTADRVAARLGCHPFDLWPEWYDLDPAAPR